MTGDTESFHRKLVWLAATSPVYWNFDDCSRHFQDCFGECKTALDSLQDHSGLTRLAKRFSHAQWRWWTATILCLATTILLFHAYSSDSWAVASLHNAAPQSSRTSYLAPKPANTKINALIFFGRRDRVQILDCYLKRNLAENGGWLDEVHWARNTDNAQDLRFLQDLVNSTAAYRDVTAEADDFRDAGYRAAWTNMEPGTITVKIDDDVVWMADDTIPRLVTMKLQHPEYLVVSANMINNPLMGWLHYRTGAVFPYLPELSPPDEAEWDSDMHLPGAWDEKSSHKSSWRYTDHPIWHGPANYSFRFNDDPPSRHHRWLRLDPNTTQAERISQLRRTPIFDAEYGTWGNSLKSWAIAAQQHYSLLEHLAHSTLDAYKLSSSPWITDYARLSINLIVVNSSEIQAHLPVPEDVVDEQWITADLPRELNRSTVVDTQALAAHLTFGFQRNMSTTDVLERYWDYAERNICAGS